MAMLFREYLHSIYTKTGFTGTLDFDFNKTVSINIKIDQNIDDCFIAMYENETVTFDDKEIIDRLDSIDRFRTFGLPAGIMVAAKKQSEEDLSFIPHEPFNLI